MYIQGDPFNRYDMENIPKRLQLTLCDTQGQLFELSVKHGLDSRSFVETYMTSSVSDDMDKSFHHVQWAGKGYILSRLMDEHPDSLTKGGEVYDGETMYWMGYIYRHWHFQTGERSIEIYNQAPVETMRSAYPMYHTMSPDMAVERLKETYSDKIKNDCLTE